MNKQKFDVFSPEELMNINKSAQAEYQARRDPKNMEAWQGREYWTKRGADPQWVSDQFGEPFNPNVSVDDLIGEMRDRIIADREYNARQKTKPGGF